jgi:putative hydrolase of the HAD superfamily
LTTFRGIIFDLFHTLTGPERVLRDYPKTNEVLGIDDVTWQRASIATREWRLSGKVRDPFAIVRGMADIIDPAIPDSIVHEAARARVRRSAYALDTVPESNLALLRALRERGLRLGLISNLDAADISGWPTCALGRHFHAAILSCEVGLVKPDPAIYALCLDRLELTGVQCVYIGDGAGDELVGARAAGCYTLLFTGMIEHLWPERIPRLAEAADRTIRRLEELSGLLGVEGDSL